jgi:DNA-binding CsgD family transcriptional regulator
MKRVTPSSPLSEMQYVVAVLLGLGKSHAEIAAELHISVPNVRAHMRFAAAKLPGDLPREARLVAWVRGATEDVLKGVTLRGEVMMQSERGAIDEPPEIVKRSKVSL